MSSITESWVSDEVTPLVGWSWLVWTAKPCISHQMAMTEEIVSQVKTVVNWTVGLICHFIKFSYFWGEKVTLENFSDIFTDVRSCWQVGYLSCQQPHCWDDQLFDIRHHLEAGLHWPLHKRNPAGWFLQWLLEQPIIEKQEPLVSFPPIKSQNI